MSKDRGLIGYWALDEVAAGAVVFDSSGFELHGTPSPSPPTPSTDVAPTRFPNRRSLSFNGVDQFVSLGNPPILNLGGPITLAAWVRVNSIDGYRTFITHGYRTNPNYDLGLRVTDTLEYEFSYWEGLNHDARMKIPATDVGVWVHLCGTFDGASYNLYRNGELVKTRPDSTAPVANVENVVWSIGGHAGLPKERPMDGEIDDVRFYARALTADEVRALYRR